MDMETNTPFKLGIALFLIFISQTTIAVESTKSAKFIKNISLPLQTPSLILQNATNYNLVLSKATLSNAICNPACTRMSTLIPNALQTYSFSAEPGFIIFDYDVMDNLNKIGHITIKTNSQAASITNGLGGEITQTEQYYKIYYVRPIPHWRGKFTDVTNWANNNWNITPVLPHWGAENIEVKTSNQTEPSPRGNNYIRVHYPAGSANYQSAPPVGGAQFYGALLNTKAPITLSFNVLFPPIFPFSSPTRGSTLGKLPGLYGGIGNTGTNIPSGYDGWTTRFMWGDWASSTNLKYIGAGQLLQFTLGSNLEPFGTRNGTFLGCGNWIFVPDGKWHNLQQTIHLNDVGKANGRIDVCYDGIPVMTEKNISFRNTAQLQTNGILFQTFFGGTGKDYSTPIDTYTDFSDFALYYYPPSAPAGLCITDF